MNVTIVSYTATLDSGISGAQHLTLMLPGAIGGLHLLPVYPSSGDGGFAPLTYQEIDPEMGTWEDIERLAKKYELLMECMCAPRPVFCFGLVTVLQHDSTCV